MTPFLYPLQACKPLNLSIIQSQTSTVQERKILSSKLPSSKLPSRSLTACPWKVALPIGKDRLRTIIFQGRTVQLRGGVTVRPWKLVLERRPFWLLVSERVNALKTWSTSILVSTLRWDGWSTPVIKGDSNDSQLTNPLMVSLPHHSHIFRDSGMGVVYMARVWVIGCPWKSQWFFWCNSEVSLETHLRPSKRGRAHAKWDQTVPWPK